MQKNKPVLALLSTLHLKSCGKIVPKFRNVSIVCVFGLKVSKLFFRLGLQSTFWSSNYINICQPSLPLSSSCHFLKVLLALHRFDTTKKAMSLIWCTFDVGTGTLELRPTRLWLCLLQCTMRLLSQGVQVSSVPIGWERLWPIQASTSPSPSRPAQNEVGGQWKTNTTSPFFSSTPISTPTNVVRSTRVLFEQLDGWKSCKMCESQVASILCQKLKRAWGEKKTLIIITPAAAAGVKCQAVILLWSSYGRMCC